MNLYKITVHGCDDSTTVLKVIDSEEEVSILRNTAESITQASTYGCMPTMEVDKITAQDEIYYAIEGVFNYEADVLSFYFEHHDEKEFLLESSWRDSIIENLKHNKELLNVLQLELKPVEDVFSDDYILVKTGDTKALIDNFAEKA